MNDDTANALLDEERARIRREIKNYDRIIGAFTLPRSVRGPAKVKRHNLVKALARLDKVCGRKGEGRP